MAVSPLSLKRTLHLLLIGGTALAGAACEQPTSPSPDQGAERLRAWVNATGLVLSPGDEFQMAVTIWDPTDHQTRTFSGSLGDSLDAVWESSAPEIARLSPDGLLTAHGRGRARITVQVSEVRDSATVTVVESPPAPAQGFVDLGVGGMATCGLDREGLAYCWGSDWDGGLGRGEVRRYTAAGTPDPVRGGHRFTTLVNGGGHSCGIGRDGETYCWGQNTYGALGNGTIGGPPEDPIIFGRPEPAPVLGGHRFVDLTAGAWHTCGLTAEGRAYCWGWNAFGQLGTGATPDIDGTPQPVAVAGSLDLIRISAGIHHTCAVAEDRAVYCWGANNTGQIGSDVGEPCSGGYRCTPVPVRVPAAQRFDDVAAGGEQTCALAESSAFCWGRNGSGLGEGEGTVRDSPAVVDGLPPLRAITAGSKHTCALSEDGAGYCWGVNREGQLGRGTVSGWGREPPGPVQGARRFASIDALNKHTCATTDEGPMFCWGWNRHGEIGDGSVRDPGGERGIHVSRVPVPVIDP